VQVIFSDKAIVSLSIGDSNNQVRFQVRVYDVDAKHPVVEARCRMYAVLKERAVPIMLRLIQPNDELGAPLFLSLPSVIVHHLDHYSALHPHTTLPVSTAGLTLRQVDSIISNREEVVCPICGESYGTHKRWVDHVHNQLRNERKFNFPVKGTHQSLTEEQLLKSQPPQATLQELQHYFQNEVAEVIVIVSGQDPLTSGSFQALQSYRYQDIIWDPVAFFHPCIAMDDKTQKLSVDLDRFHQVDYYDLSDATDGDADARKPPIGPPPRSRNRSLSVRAADFFFWQQ
jgi:hypothetical protein